MVTLKELTPAIETLNTQSDAVNIVIADLNAKLEKLNVGISIDDGPFMHATGWEVTRNDAGDPVSRTRTAYYLGYGKLHDRWQLALVNCGESQEYTDGRLNKTQWGDDEIESAQSFFTALPEAPRHLRIKALSNLDGLLSIIKGRAEQQTETIQAARKLVDTL
jgi:hypothetical protein